MKRAIKKLTPEARERLRLVEQVLAGETRRDVARAAGINESTLGDWVQRYESGGVDALNVPRKPRPNTRLDVAQVQDAIAHAPEMYHDRLDQLLRLAHGEKLKDVAARYNISVQAVMKTRRAFQEGSFPPKNAE